MRILVTEVTEMHKGNYCVAGWSFENGTMVRPMPNGAHWTAALLSSHNVTPGAYIEFNALGQPQSAYPHRTEDTLIDASTIKQNGFFAAPWLGSVAPPTAATLHEAFEDNVRNNSSWNGFLQGVYVPFGAQTRSLFAVSTPGQNLRFFQDQRNKLRAYLVDRI